MNGAIVLCGGASSRMGRDKASLPFGSDATLLSCVIDVLQEVVARENIVVVAGRGQQAPSLAGGVAVVHESADGSGPLVALVEGLAQLRPAVAAAFACGCDMPLLKPEFVTRMLELAGEGVDAVVPAEADRLHPLAAAYASASWPKLRTAVDAGERSLHRALRSGRLHVREIGVDALRAVDPELLSLLNCNSPEEYERALRHLRLSR